MNRIGGQEPGWHRGIPTRRLSLGFTRQHLPYPIKSRNFHPSVCQTFELAEIPTFILPNRRPDAHPHHPRTLEIINRKDLAETVGVEGCIGFANCSGSSEGGRSERGGGDRIPGLHCTTTFAIPPSSPRSTPEHQVSPHEQRDVPFAAGRSPGLARIPSFVSTYCRTTAHTRHAMAHHGRSASANPMARTCRALPDPRTFPVRVSAGQRRCGMLGARHGRKGFRHS